VTHEEDDWSRALSTYRQLHRDAERAGHRTDWVEGALSEIDRSIHEIRTLRAELDRSAASITEHQEENRTVREQLGHALDELLLDDSKLGGELAELAEKLAPAEARLDVAVQAIMHDTGALPQTLRAGELITPRHLAALQELTRANAELALARDNVHRLRARVKRKEGERKDLRFQMTELKQRLELSSRTTTVEQQLWHSEADRISAQIQLKLEQLAPVCARVAKHFGTEASPKRRTDTASTERTLG
jgi:chromosome segregation ATPase